MRGIILWFAAMVLGVALYRVALGAAYQIAETGAISAHAEFLQAWSFGREDNARSSADSTLADNGRNNRGAAPEGGDTRRDGTAAAANAAGDGRKVSRMSPEQRLRAATAIAKAMLAHFGIAASAACAGSQGEGQESVPCGKFLERVLNHSGGADPARTSLLDLASHFPDGFLTALPKGNPNSDGHPVAGPKELRAVEAAYARLLVGWPAALDREAAAVSGYGTLVDGKQSQGDVCTDANCVAVSRHLPLLSVGLFWGRTGPWSAPALAQSSIAPENCSIPGTPAANRCLLLTRIFEAVLDNPTVRFWRAFGVNFAYGWQRTLVAILFFAVLFEFLLAERRRRRLGEQARWLIREISAASPEEAAASKQQEGGVAASDRKPEAVPPSDTTMIERFLSRFGAPEQKGVVAGLIAAHGHRPGGGGAREGHIRAIARFKLNEMDRHREYLGGLITIFPVIGFAATLLSLVAALGSADEIASGSGDARAAAVLHVMGMLSAAFATTCLALVCMAFFAVWSVLQRNAERRTIDQACERLIISVGARQ